MNQLTPEQQKEVDSLNEQISSANNRLKFYQHMAEIVRMHIRELTAKRCEITGE